MQNEYQVMPDLSAEEYEELKADIAQRGVMVPIEYDEAGNVLDGHHRLKICEELGIRNFPKVIRAGMTEEEKLLHAKKLNMARRHLTQEQKRELIRQQLRETPYKSNLKIASDLGVSDKTVGVQRKEMEINGEIENIDDAIKRKIAENPNASNSQIAKEIGVSDKTVSVRRTSSENSEIPNSPNSCKPVSVFNPSKREERALKDSRVVERLQKTGGNVANTAKQIAKEDKAKRKAYVLPAAIPEDSMKLFTADISDGLPEIADKSVDFVITDPPYMKDYLPLYADLALVSSRVLKPGGSLLVMCGQSYLPEVFLMLNSALTYHWTLCYLTPGGQSPQLFQKKVNTFWKPVLWFTKGHYEGGYIGDVLKSPVNDNDKRFHEWGQSLDGIKDIIERFTMPGDIILDPFLGGGTTGAAAITTGRKFIGSDKEAKNIEISKERIEKLYARSQA